MSLTNVSNQMAYVNQVNSYKKDVKNAVNTESRTIGSPKLSAKAQKYYDQLKEKYGDMDFILVSKDMAKGAMDSAASYESDKDTLVIVDEETIEKMASDEEYRKKYEGLLEDSKSQLDQMREEIEKNNKDGLGTIKNIGIQINGDGTTSFFAVMEKNSERIAEKVKEQRAERKADAKAAAEKRADKKAEQKAEEAKKAKVSETTILKSDSKDGLMKAIRDLQQSWLADYIRTPEEEILGQSIDFRG